jgi:quercetin dioxygenase-like cupin family protein
MGHRPAAPTNRAFELGCPHLVLASKPWPADAQAEPEGRSTWNRSHAWVSWCGRWSPTRQPPTIRSSASFLCDGEFLTANLAIVQDAGNALHTQPRHDEVVVVLDGEVDFRVGDTIRRVQPGDLVFIPRDTLHGPILADGDRPQNRNRAGAGPSHGCTLTRTGGTP